MKRASLSRIGIAIFGIIVWFIPPPDRLTDQTWHLYAILITAIQAEIANALPIHAAALLALAASIFTGTLDPE